MDSFTCFVEDLDIVLEEKILEPYLRENQRAMADGIDKTMREMVKDTKKNANVDDARWEKKGFPNHRKAKGHGTFKKAITWKKNDYYLGHSATWYVRSPEYRLTHLLVHGHEKFIFGRPTGERVEPDPNNLWLHNARDKAAKNLLPNIIEEIEKKK